MSHIDFISRDLIPTTIEHERVSRDFRPTAVVIARKKESFLLTEPKDHAGTFWFLQGGIRVDENEPLFVAAAREAHEEANLGLCPDRFKLLDGVAYRNSGNRDGYASGKLLVGCFIEFDETNSDCKSVRPNLEEILSVRFASEEEIRAKIIPTNLRMRPETRVKAEFTIHLLDSVASVVQPA